MERRFKREIKSLDKIFDFINEFVTAHNVDDSMTFSINFVVEELFTNMVKYNSQSEHDILVSLSREDNKLIIRLTDFDAELFDVTKAEDVNIHQRLEDRKIGGLGIHLVKKMVDQVNYEYVNRQSTVTLIKNLEK